MRRQLIGLFVLGGFISLVLISSYVGAPYSQTSTLRPHQQMQIASLGTEDYVDQLSNLHAPTDIGAHSSFAAEQAKDSSFDTLTEADAASSSNVGAEGGSGASFRTVAINQARGTYGWSYDTGTVSTGYAYVKTSSGTVNAKLFITDSSDHILTSGVSQATAITNTAGLFSFTFSPAVSLNADTEYHIYLVSAASSVDLYYYSTTDSTSYYDSTNSYATPTDPTDRTSATDLYRELYVVVAPTANYRLDLEIGWTAANYTQGNEYLCIYTGSVNAENLKVDVWSGSAWTNVIAALSASQWNNISVHSYLTGIAFEIRFVDATQTGDTVQSTWQIDAVLLHTWSSTWHQAGVAQIWFNVHSADAPSWHNVGPAILYFFIELNLAGLSGILVLVGLILIPVSTLYLAHGGREDLTNEKLFFFLILFFVGWSFVLGGIMP